jgi:NADPH-dependent 2,4-dienoyl-CoA reductase/sulfur reductase-like enzyme/rhodanese-related sulfurtransferase
VVKTRKIIIVGGVAGGATAAARLRRLDENAEIILFERGGHISFANCGLPYYVGGVIKDRSDLFLQTPESFRARFNVDVRALSEATSINPADKTVAVKNLRNGDTYVESYDKLILSPGASAILPPIPGADLPGVFTLRSAADIDIIERFIHTIRPKNAVVVGGGYIGVEMAENLKLAGLEVTIIEMSNQILPTLDFDVACDARRYLLKKGVSLRLNAAARKISAQNGVFTVYLEDGEIYADIIIIAAGVRPETRLAKEAGLEIGESGGIVVNERLQTSDEHIYAVGDAVEVDNFIVNRKGLLPLAGNANKQGRIAADNICGIPSVYSGAQGSVILKIFDMTAAATGISERTAARLGLDYDKIFLWLPGRAAYYPDSKFMSMKIIFEKVSGKILGAQIAGFEGADKRCDVLSTAIRAGMTARDLAKLELCYAPPFSSAKDPVNMAGYAIENVLNGMVKNFHWNDVDALPRDGSVVLLDTRSPAEYASGRVEGSINVPLDSLRGRVGELDKSKPIYVICHSGLRGYVAARILSQNGFEAYNLSGGYRLYRSASSRF